MKKITFLLSLLATINVLSQETEIFLKKKVEKLFADVSVKNLSTTLPFRNGRKVGFVDAKTLKIVVKPVDYIDVRNTFCPNLPSAIIYDTNGNYFFSISKEKEVKLTSVNNFMNDIIDDAILPFQDNTNKVIEISENKGFEVDSEGNIIKISKEYVSETGSPNAFLFQYDKKHYAIVKKDHSIAQKEGIIDEKGNHLPHFNFVFHNIIPNKYATNSEPWFYVQEKEDDEGYFLSFSGKKIQLKGVQWINWEKIIFGYAIASNDITKKYGVLDLSTMEWVIPLQEKHYFGQILYTSKEELDIDNIENRQKAVMYVESWSKDRVFLIDFNLNEYFPKN